MRTLITIAEHVLNAALFLALMYLIATGGLS